MRFVTIALAAATLLPLTSYAVLGGAPMTGSSSAMSLRAAPPRPPHPHAASTSPVTSPPPRPTRRTNRATPTVSR
jgi:hypothetical protein